MVRVPAEVGLQELPEAGVLDVDERLVVLLAVAGPGEVLLQDEGVLVGLDGGGLVDLGLLGDFDSLILVWVILADEDPDSRRLSVLYAQ